MADASMRRFPAGRINGDAAEDPPNPAVPRTVASNASSGRGPLAQEQLEESQSEEVSHVGSCLPL